MKGDSRCPSCFGTGTRRVVESYLSGDEGCKQFTTRVHYNRKCTFNRKKLRKIRVEKEE